VFHSFTGGPEDVARIKSVGDYYFGINGVVTFKNAAELREAVPLMGLDRILLETDSPYLAPVPHRGKRNESAYLPNVQAKLAELLSLDNAAAEARFVANTKALFNI
jgi:TatD DNase family protein